MEEEKEEFFPLLSIGIHSLTEAELKKICVDRFPDSENRPKIFAGLQQIIGKLKSSEVPGDLWIDGSFITEKPEPNDVDLLLVITRDRYEQRTVNADEAIYWFISDAVEELYCDTQTLVYEQIDDWKKAKSKQEWREYWNYCRWIGHFGFARNRTTKGIASIELG